MIIIFGTRSYFRTKKSRQFGFCPHCNRFTKFSSWNGAKFFHLYYLPLIPLSGRVRHHKCCAKCRMLREFKPSEYDALLLRFKELAAHALLALRDGNRTFEMEDSAGEEHAPLETLLSTLDWFYASNDQDFIQGVLEQLNRPEFRYAESMVLAELAKIQGKLDEAISHYDAAGRVSPKNYEPVQQQAHLLVERKRFNEAIDAYQSALALAPDVDSELNIRLQLAEQQMARKLFPDAVANFEQILKINPELAHVKAVSNQFMKAKKKAGIKA